MMMRAAKGLSKADNNAQTCQAKDPHKRKARRGSDISVNNPRETNYAEPLPCQMKRSAVGEDRSWHYRLVHHGIWDHDIPRPRIADHVIQSFLGDAARISFSLSEITASCAPPAVMHTISGL